MFKRLFLFFMLAVFLSVNAGSILYGQVSDTLVFSNLRAGVAKVDITPPITIPLGGYGNRQGPATGIRDPLFAAVIVFDDGENKAVLITADLLQVFQETGDSIRTAINRITGIPGDYVIINVSHTHGSPWLETDINYKNEVIAKIAGAVAIAANRLQPVSMGYGEGRIDFNINRRCLDEQGRCYDCLNPEGICDHRVKVLRIDIDNRPQPMAVLMHAVCHANVLRGSNTLVSADYPGVAKTFVERAFDERTVCLFLQGCCGDIRPYLPSTDTTSRGYGRSGSEVDLVGCGYSLGAEVVKVAAALRIREQANKRQRNFRITAVSDILELIADSTRAAEISFPREHIVNGRAEIQIRAMRIGFIWFFGLPGEPVVEYGLQIERGMSQQDRIFVMGYTAGNAGYIPVEHMFEEGGYEAECPFTPACEREILTGYTHLVDRIRSVSTGDSLRIDKNLQMAP
jgi:neutral ceramidase